MATTTTNYIFDKSGRMTTMWSADTADATYFTYNQRNMVTKILRLPAGGDATRTLAYNAAGERVVVDETGGTTPNYWTYDRYKLLTEKTSAGSTTRRYRHNALPQERVGSNIELKSASFGSCAPVTDQIGVLTNVLNIEGNDVFWTNTFGEGLASMNALGDRLRLPQGSGTQALTTALPFSVTPSGGVYFSRLGITFGGADELRGAFGLLVASVSLDSSGRGLVALLRHGVRMQMIVPNVLSWRWLPLCDLADDFAIWFPKEGFGEKVGAPPPKIVPGGEPPPGHADFPPVRFDSFFLDFAEAFSTATHCAGGIKFKQIARIRYIPPMAEILGKGAVRDPSGNVVGEDTWFREDAPGGSISEGWDAPAPSVPPNSVPGVTDLFTDYFQYFETCAICMPGKVVLGCIQWGVHWVEVDDHAGGKTWKFAGSYFDSNKTNHPFQDPPPGWNPGLTYTPPTSSWTGLFPGYS